MTSLHARFTQLHEDSAGRVGRPRQALTMEQTKDWIRRNAPSQMKSPVAWRGTYGASAAEYFLLNPSGHKRHAASGNDFYRALLDDSNPGWPKRTDSLIASTQRGHAAAFGTNLYAVFIPDDAKVGVVSSGPDIWTTGIQRLDDDIDDAYSFVSHDLGFENQTVQTLVGWKPDGAPDRVTTTVAQWKSAIEFLIAAVQQARSEDYGAFDDARYSNKHLFTGDTVLSLVCREGATVESVWQALRRRAEYETGRFDLVSPAQLRKYDKPVELWTDRECLLVHADAITELIAELGQ